MAVDRFWRYDCRMIRRSSLLQRLSTEARAIWQVLLLLLMVPVLHPVAEGFAANGAGPLVICSAFGATEPDISEPDISEPDISNAGLPDDGPECLACALASVGVPPIGADGLIHPLSAISKTGQAKTSAQPAEITQMLPPPTGPPTRI
jgi:hypothetical protein